MTDTIKKPKGGRTVHASIRLTPETNEIIEKLREDTFNSYSDVITIAVLAYYQRSKARVYDLRDAQDGDAE